jgi:hypothetical protein
MMARPMAYVPMISEISIPLILMIMNRYMIAPIAAVATMPSTIEGR